MTVEALAVAACTSACLALAAAAFVAALRNLAEFQRLRRLPPLDETEIARATTRPAPIPPRWPRPESIDDARVAAAYRDLVRDLREGYHFVGGILTFVAGAALGVTIGSVGSGGWRAWQAYLWLGVGSLGLTLRRMAEVYGTNLGNRYERRREALMRPPPSPEPQRWFRRRRR